MIKEFNNENQAKAIADSLGLLMTKYKDIYIISNNKEEILARYNLGYNNGENVFYDKEVFVEGEDGYIVIRDRGIVDASLVKLPYGLTDCSCMFSNCPSLEIPPIIPEGVQNCSYMFYYCSFLKIPPNIPEGVQNCESMFENCISLKTPPVLPSSIRYCIDMFYSCTSLEIPPNIPEDTADCIGMFQGCSSIKKRPRFPENCDTRDALKDTPFERFNYDKRI